VTSLYLNRYAYISIELCARNVYQVNVAIPTGKVREFYVVWEVVTLKISLQEMNWI